MTDGMTVYIVEDDGPLRDSLVALLEAEGFEATGFASGSEFLSGFHPDGTSCLILDVDTSGDSGEGLLRLLGDRLHHLPVLALTMRTEEESVERFLALGADSVFPKLSDPSVLIRRIRELDT